MSLTKLATISPKKYFLYGFITGVLVGVVILDKILENLSY